MHFYIMVLNLFDYLKLKCLDIYFIILKKHFYLKVLNYINQIIINFFYLQNYFKNYHFFYQMI